MPEVAELSDLRAWLAAEIAREDDGIRNNLGAGLMHMNDQAYMIGLVRNSVRREILARVDGVVAESGASANAVEESKPGATLLNEHPDTTRLNWLESRRLAYNMHYGTEYGWKFVTSPMVNRLFVKSISDIDLNDAQSSGKDIRAAIDAAREGEKP